MKIPFEQKYSSGTTADLWKYETSFGVLYGGGGGGGHLLYSLSLLYLFLPLL